MASRLELQELLEGVLGSSEVYFQPPENVRMSYPAIVYERDLHSNYADDVVYHIWNKYTITLITVDPDSELPYKIAELPTCSPNSRYVAENLYHDIFTLIY